MAHNMVGWFEIPVSDMARAKTFYETVFQVEIALHDFGGLQMGWFPDRGEVTGAQGTLIKQDSYIPSQEGTLIYFISEDVQNELDRIEAAGGQIYQPKTQISPEHGYMAAFIDSEGNRIALHSRA
ncbi:VOC family protein [Mangrovimonas sp. YM274]|uniref:VOC family protein n=1 Tax=Mangrovimonas sp. YM274 TaxID=3070660 RepID=UPI0027DDDA32|nr:VOC family protein [Mangrovimonas sp. YM274]WMI67687.1 VOC family protein [Mangrovimonas sp. YM274]